MAHCGSDPRLEGRLAMRGYPEIIEEGFLQGIPTFPGAYNKPGGDEMQKTKKKKAPSSSPYKKRLGWRAFFSLLLILGAIYVREKEPQVASWTRTQLHISTDLSGAYTFMEKHLPDFQSVGK